MIDPNSLFDTGADRYGKYYSNVVQGTTCQVGLAIFRYEIETESYVSDAYNFYICPRAFASHDPRFVCQASSLEFLSMHGFDFNRVLIYIYCFLKYNHSTSHFAVFKGRHSIFE